MTTSSFKIWRCDRCGAEVQTDAKSLPEGWGRIAAERAGTDVRIGHAEVGYDDLCVECLADLFLWYSGPRNLRASPVPPATVAPPPLLTDEARGVAVTRAAILIGDQMAEALRAIQERPTSVLAGEWPEEAMAGLPKRAEALVDSILDQLRRGPRKRKGGGGERGKGLREAPS